MYHCSPEMKSKKLFLGIFLGASRKTVKNDKNNMQKQEPTQKGKKKNIDISFYMTANIKMDIHFFMLSDETKYETTKKIAK